LTAFYSHNPNILTSVEHNTESEPEHWWLNWVGLNMYVSNKI